GGPGCGGRTCARCSGRPRARCAGAGHTCTGRTGTRGTCATRAARGRAARGGAPPTPRPGATAPPPAPGAAPGEHGSLQDQQRGRREEGREDLGVGAKLGAELAARLTGLQVAANRAAYFAQTLGGLGELEADVVAGELARLARLGECDPGTDEQRL